MLQRIDQGRLAFDQLAPRDSRVEPCGPVDLGERSLLAGSAGPFDDERVASELRGVEVALDCPCHHALAATLPHLAELQRLPGRRRETRLLLELATRGRVGVLPLLVFALDDRPGAVVLPREERAAHVGDENL